MSLLAIGLLGGITGVDATSLAQTMVSRPFVAATLAGAVVGRPAEGAILGSTLELFALVILPVGAARYPESGTAAVAATVAYANATAVMSPSVMLIAVLFALVWERIAGWTVVLDRRFNEQFVALAPLSNDRPDRLLERRHLGAIGIDFIRAVVVTIAGVALGTLALRSVAQLWNMNAVIAPAILSIGLSCMAGAALPLFGGLRARKVALLAGIVSGSLILLLR